MFEFSLINKNNIISEIYSSSNINFIFYQYLNKINDIISIITTHQMNNKKFNMQLLNLDYLFVIEKKYDRDNNYIISNIFKFSLNDYLIYDNYNITYDLKNFEPYILNIVNDIKKNMNLPVNNIPLKQFPNSNENGNLVKTNDNDIQNKDLVIQNELNNSLNSIMNILKKNNSDIDTTCYIKGSNINDDNNASIDNNSINNDNLNNQDNSSNDDNLSNDDGSINFSDDDISDININDNETVRNLKQLIKEINLLKHKKKKNLEIKKKAHTDNIKSYTNFSSNLNEDKMIYNNEKEKKENLRRKFDADLRAYYLIKNDISNKKIKVDDIIALFNNYDIFKFMDDHDLLKENMDDIYRIYLELLEDSNDNSKNSKEYVPHNINYLTDDEKIKYQNITQKKDMIDEFITNKSSKDNNIPSLNEVLDSISIDSEDSEDSEESQYLYDSENDSEEDLDDSEDLEDNKTLDNNHQDNFNVKPLSELDYTLGN